LVSGLRWWEKNNARHERDRCRPGIAECGRDKFKVAGSVFSTSHKDASPEQWEAALGRAKQRTAAGKWPVITTDDF
jgi:hypothetical protein